MCTLYIKLQFAVVEGALQLICIIKQTRGDPYNHEGYQNITVTAQWMVASIRDLQKVAECSVSEDGLILG